MKPRKAPSERKKRTENQSEQNTFVVVASTEAAFVKNKSNYAKAENQDCNARKEPIR